MKTIPKHLVTVLPRVRSNSVSSPRLYSSSSLSLFDSSGPPASRPVLSPNRLCIEGKPAEVEGSQSSQQHSHSHPPFSLALAQPQSSTGQTLANTNPQGQYALFPYSTLTQTSHTPQHSSQQTQDSHTHPRPKRQRLKYQLDVGAYGIPKRCRAVPSSRRHHSQSALPHHSSEELSLSVQVGEDAYFVRDNAMGVADGVGGWSKSSSRPATTPSALFAKRLMHFCSAEVGSTASGRSSSESSSSAPPTVSAPKPQPTFQTGSGSHLNPPSRPQFSFTHHLRPRSYPHTNATSALKWSDSFMSSSLPTSWSLHDVFNNTNANTPLSSASNHSHFTFLPEECSSTAAERDLESDLEQDLEDSLEELSEGIDVLQILERAYDKTLRAHVVPEPLPQSSTPPNSTTTPQNSTSLSSQRESTIKPLLTGSSTALLAVLDHAPRTVHVSTASTSTSTTTASPSPPPLSSSSNVTGSFSPVITPHPKETKLPSPFVSSFTTSNTTTFPRADSNPPKTKKNVDGNNTTAQSPIKTTSTATTTTFTATASSSSLSSSLSSSESASVECELEECDCEGEYDAVIKIAHVGDCMGMLVRDEDIVWRSEEMWWDFNTPVQLGPSTSTTVTPRNSAMVITIPVKADDILILASDGLSDNLWDEDVLDEVVRFKKSFLNSTAAPSSKDHLEERHNQSMRPSLDENDSGYSSSSSIEEETSINNQEGGVGAGGGGGSLKRKTLAGMLSEALCSRARRVSERKGSSSPFVSSSSSSSLGGGIVDMDEVPFARRAREVGKRFSGGKNDDISVVVAVISPRAK